VNVLDIYPPSGPPVATFSIEAAPAAVSKYLELWNKAAAKSGMNELRCSLRQVNRPNGLGSYLVLVLHHPRGSVKHALKADCDAKVVRAAILDLLLKVGRKVPFAF
jgi:hypothetical protein